jgi:hypothetical protein
MAKSLSALQTRIIVGAGSYGLPVRAHQRARGVAFGA